MAATGRQVIVEGQFCVFWVVTVTLAWWLNGGVSELQWKGHGFHFWL